MKIERVEQFYIRMPLKSYFETSFGRQDAADKLIIAIYADGIVGYGESPVEKDPFYSHETVETCWHVQRDYLIPLLLNNPIDTAISLPDRFARVRGHSMAKAGIEAAVWDLEGKRSGKSVSNLLGGTRKVVASGVSIGIQSSVNELIQKIGVYLEEGYQRIKIKIKHGWDSAVVREVRKNFPEILLMVDANSAYTLDDLELLTALDGFNLLMIEQPLHYFDIIDHAKLQSQLKTPICLDESIETLGRAREALYLKSCRIINIKPARVSGVTEARRIHDVCQQALIPVWCGGLLESGIGRAHNLAVASLPNFSLPGDISASDRYWHEDIVEPSFALNTDGTIDVPGKPGIGVNVIRKRLDSVTERRAEYVP
jgi:O-succinylbenzoate synthase